MDDGWRTKMADKIMIVRHGEKPEKDEDIHGVNPEGEHDKNELSTSGWQRSGALIRFFNPLHGQFIHPALAKPNAVFAAAPSGHIQSERSHHTVKAVAESLGLKVNLKHTKGDERKLAEEAMTTHGVVLIAWEHKSIIDLANVILGNDRSSPQKWPDSRFDLVWVLDRQLHPTSWKLTQVAQMLLPNDSPKLL
jgi:hypothetical protein